MPKRIIIIGGGISGLALLHYLKKRFPNTDQVHILLLEKSQQSGGTIRTQRENETVFEEGANGFLSYKEEIRSLITELNLDSRLTPANPHAKERFIRTKGYLLKLPNNPLELFTFSGLSLSEKWRVLKEPFISSKADSNETIYDFASRRLGDGFARLFIDTMVKGIYGGSSKKLIIKESFPHMYEMEKEHGSLTAGVIHLIKAMLCDRSKKEASGPRALMSFKKGMGELMEGLYQEHKASIIINRKVEQVERSRGGFVVHSDSERYQSDLVYVATPAYVASKLLATYNRFLSEELNKVTYAPIGVVGLLYRKDHMQTIPRGFGYIKTFEEKGPVLGTLFTTSMYPAHSSNDEFLFRVMIQGDENLDKAEIKNNMIQIAENELREVFQIDSEAVNTFYRYWPKAIPQYDASYAKAKKIILEEIEKDKGLFLLANYLGGVSMNDCVKNAKGMALKCAI